MTFVKRSGTQPLLIVAAACVIGVLVAEPASLRVLHEDRRGAPGNMHEEYRAAVDDAFARTGVPKDEFTVTKTATDINGKTVPVEWRVTSGPNKGAEVNVDDPRIVPSSEGPADPHVGYQTPGKRNSGGGQRGHIILDDVPASRGRLNDD